MVDYSWWVVGYLDVVFLDECKEGAWGCCYPVEFFGVLLHEDRHYFFGSEYATSFKVAEAYSE